MLEVPINEQTLLISLATYNEVENIPEIISTIRARHLSATILIVDGKSTDGTIDKIEALQQNDKKIALVVQRKKLGIASAHIISFKYAIDHNFTYLVTMDADWSHSPLDIAQLLQTIDGNDVVLGSRYCAGGSSAYKGIRDVVSRTANLLAGWVINHKLHEFTTSFRVFRVSVFSQIDVGAINSNGYSFFFKVVFALSQKGIKIAEAPINFGIRKYGKSKIPKLEIFRSFSQLSKLRISHNFLNESVAFHHSPCGACKSNFRVLVSKKNDVLISCLICGNLSLVNKS